MQPTNLNMQNVMNGTVPCEGPKSFSFELDFTVATEYDFDFTNEYQRQQFTTLQCAYVDNSQNTSPLTITMNGTSQTIVCPKNACGFFPLLATMPPRGKVETAGAVARVYVGFLNYYIPPTVWSTL